MKKFEPTIEDVKAIIMQFEIDGEKASCTDEQASAVLQNWHDRMDDQFYDHVKDEFMEGEMFNGEDDDR